MIKDVKIKSLLDLDWYKKKSSVKTTMASECLFLLTWHNKPDVA